MNKRFLIVFLTVCMAAMLLFSGCTAPSDTDTTGSEPTVTATPTAEHTAEPTAEPTDAPTGEPTPEPTVTPAPAPENTSNKEPGHYEFNPHVFSPFYLKAYGEGYMNDFFRFCDAVRNGEDTFRCENEDAYGWCLGRFSEYFFPIARYYASMYAENDEDFVGSWVNGVGHIYYKIPKDEYLQKEREFEQQITDILNAAIGDDYDDFEKALGLYEYMTRNFTYDYELMEMQGNGYDGPRNTVYSLLTTGKAVCQQIGGLYAYLLLQCGVEAGEISNGSGYPYNHQWTYVVLDGKGYHADATWGLTSSIYGDDGEKHMPFLTYFLMTDRERSAGDLDGAATYTMAGLGEDSRKELDFWASDDRFSVLHIGAEYIGMDRQNKNVKYLDDDGNEQLFHYGK